MRCSMWTRTSNVHPIVRVMVTWCACSPKGWVGSILCTDSMIGSVVRHIIFFSFVSFHDVLPDVEQYFEVCGIFHLPTEFHAPDSAAPYLSPRTQACTISRLDRSLPFFSQVLLGRWWFWGAMSQQDVPRDWVDMMNRQVLRSVCRSVNCTLRCRHVRVCVRSENYQQCAIVWSFVGVCVFICLFRGVVSFLLLYPVFCVFCSWSCVCLVGLILFSLSARASRARRTCDVNYNLKWRIVTLDGHPKAVLAAARTDLRKTGRRTPKLFHLYNM